MITDATSLAAAITPSVQSHVDSHRDEMIEDTKLNRMAKRMLGWFWPIFLRWVPWLVEAGVTAALDELSTMTLGQAGSLLANHKSSRPPGSALPRPWVAPGTLESAHAESVIDWTARFGMVPTRPDNPNDGPDDE